MTNAIGHLTSSFGITHAGTVVSGNESFQWDAMGRLQAEMQCTPSTCGSGGYPTSRQYDLLGNETSFSDSSVTRSATYDAANRLKTFMGNFPGIGNQTLLSISAHDPFGGLSAATLGNGFAETRAYTYRGWLGNISVTNGGTSIYSLTGPDGPQTNWIRYAGNGNVLNVTDNINGTWAYTYDGVNRLQTASVGGQSFNYSPDQYGNMYCTAPAGFSCTPKQGSDLHHLTFDSATNRIADDDLHQFKYDSAGNLTQDGTHGYVYDTENRITCVKGTDPNHPCTSSTATNYYYDPDGKRIAKWQGQWGQPNGTPVEEYVYDISGNQVSAHNGTGSALRNELYDPTGRHVATYASSTLTYNFADWLGTERLRISSAGTVIEQCTDTPYGMNTVCNGTGGDTSPMHFTGKQRDYESGLDDFGARYFGGGNNLGRFMSPDVFYKDSHVADPQSWNEYAYARNNPLRYVDPNGEKATVTTNCSTTDNQTTCNVNISASIEIYAAPGSGITNDQLTQAATAMQNSIDNAWTGSFTQDGVTYNVSTQVTVSVADSKDAAMSSGAQNVFGMTNGPPRQGEDARTNPRSPLGGPDTGEINIKNAGSDSAHEFTHLLGVNDHTGTVLSNTNGPDQPRDLKATAQDFQWGIKEVTTRVSNMKNAGNLPASYHNQTTIRAPRFWWK